MSVDEQHVALPKLYGAPAYGRPPRSFDAQPRPVDPDDLPIEAERTDDDLEGLLIAGLMVAGHDDANGNGTGRSDGGRGSAGPGSGEGRLEARPFTLRSLGRILSGRS